MFLLSRSSYFVFFLYLFSPILRDYSFEWYYFSIYFLVCNFSFFILFLALFWEYIRDPEIQSKSFYRDSLCVAALTECAVC